MLEVHPQANKPHIKNALKKLFNVEIEKVNTLRRKGKSYMVRRKRMKKPGSKLVYVTLKEGYSLNLFEQAESQSIVTPKVRKKSVQ